MSICFSPAFVLFAAALSAEATTITRVEEQALQSRREIQNGRVNLVSVRTMPHHGGEIRNTYSIVLDGPDIRVDHQIIRPSSSQRLPMGGQYIRTDELLIRNMRGDGQSDQQFMIELRHRKSTDPEAQALRHLDDDPVFIDPRLLGMVVCPVGLFQGKPLDIFVGRANRLNSKERDEDHDGRRVRYVEYERIGDRAIARIWIDVQRAFSVIRAEIESEFRGQRLRETIENELEQFGLIWFPRRVTYKRFLVDELLFEEVTTVSEAVFNAGVDRTAFSLAGMQIDSGTRVREIPRRSKGPVMWDGKDIVPVRMQSTAIPSSAWSTSRLLMLSFGLALIGLLFCILFVKAKTA